MKKLFFACALPMVALIGAVGFAALTHWIETLVFGRLVLSGLIVAMLAMIAYISFHFWDD